MTTLRGGFWADESGAVGVVSSPDLSSIVGSGFGFNWLVPPVVA